MTKIATRLQALGWTLRSGHAQGSDRAFEAGAREKKEIFLKEDASPEALALAESIHPRWDLCDENARRLHARNCYQILGRDLLTPVKFVCCWTPCGSEDEASTSRETGGTRTAIVLAWRYAIPVFNLQQEGRLDKIKELVEKYACV
jgi:hypothetical protein